jgi:hypothetical protein
MAKRNKEQAEKVLIDVMYLMEHDYQRIEIVQNISKLHNISERQVDNYIAKGYKELASNRQKYKELLITQSITRFNDLYERNKKIADYRECRQVQDSIVKLFGLNEAEKVDVTTQGDKLGVSTEELRLLWKESLKHGHE